MVEDAGYTFPDGRKVFFWFNFGGVIGIILMGIISTRMRLTKLISLLCVSSGLGMILFALVPAQLSLMISLIFVIGILQQGGFTGFYAAAAKAYPTEIRATGVGWAMGLGRSCAVFGPWAAGYLIAAGLNISQLFFIFSVPVAVGGLIILLLKID